MQNRSIFFTRLLDPTVWQLNCVALSWHGQTILYEAPPIKNMERTRKKGCSDGKTCRCLYDTAAEPQRAILQAWCLTSKWHLCVWQKNSENATPRHITNIRSCYLLALSLFPSLSLPSSLFLRVTVSGRGEDLSRNTNTHHLNENSSLPPPQLSVLNPHTHKHITIDCHVRPRYPLQTSWLLDPAWQFKCIQKKVGEIANCHPVLPSPAKSKKL